MFAGLHVKKEKGFTNLTGVHPFISKMAIDSGIIQSVIEAYEFPDREIKNRHVNIGYTYIDIPYEKEIYGEKVKIEKLSDILYLSDIADMYDGSNDVIRRRVYHSNIQPFYHGFINGYGNMLSMFALSDQSLEAFMLLTAYTNHYFQDAFAPMHISLKDQDVHIPFEHAFDDYLYDNHEKVQSKVMTLFNKRAQIDLSKYRGITDFSAKFVRNYMYLRDKMVQDYRDGNRDFDGIQYFLYGAVVATVGNTVAMISRDYMWRRLK